MCGIAAVFGATWDSADLNAMLAAQQHRGPNASGAFVNARQTAGLAHNRLSIIDLSDAARQPMTDSSGNLQITFNGEIYNYLELRRELESEYKFKTNGDTEVLLAAYQKWGARCLDKLIGMFAFAIWDERAQTAFAARDRFGVKPLYYHEKPDGTLLVASEIKALHAAGIERAADVETWATYLAHAIYDHGEKTFWQNVKSLAPGHFLVWQNGKTQIHCWYDLAERIGDCEDARAEAMVREEYFELLKDSVKLRFRADVPIGINLSGGLDSSTLLGLVHAVEGADSQVAAYTFATGDERYDELPWVRQMLARTNHELVVCELKSQDVPALAVDVQRFQDEPFAGMPTLAYAKLFQMARERGTIVLLDGNGLDEQWAGYDYYAAATTTGAQTSVVQGTREKPTRAECLQPDFRALAKPLAAPQPFADRVRNLQYRDVRYTKIPRAMRFNDRVSMRSSTELREPFLDHRLVELAFGQPATRKISGGVRKKMLREIARKVVPQTLSEAPKRPLQTPQREWLREDLKDWTHAHIENALRLHGASWLDKTAVETAWQKFARGESDNSFYVWQWIGLSLIAQTSV